MMDASYPESTGEEGLDMMGGDTALLPKSIFPEEPEIGKTCTFKVVGIHGDEVSVEYASASEPEVEVEETAEMKIEKLPRV